ncbi:Starch-binding associating with outer membrane [Pedobacter steynii]|uniref:Starch-binding associating with outer membrane n=1 Tax=Pedobacter steynii TaxID=430522 RepID=A0A1H0F5E3_9SPHI|nr:RagB/SusD family nutrient uptake outer membrane protein [Pedobacter steynii]NQX42208.1 RagB/SusD family nutrient uptake outer membrane protein [Pedobacter steynii]SDN89811.1 Starch-binding associating with outer membrane [Pedobacter steynii]
MKTSFIYKFLLPLLILSGSLSSCRKELDKTPLDQFSNESFWTSEPNVMLALAGVYRGNIQMSVNPTGAEFSATDWWSYHGLLYTEFATDNAYDRRGDNSGFNTLTNGTLTATNGYLSNYWTASYARIARCNYFLENISKAALAPALMNRMVAEVRFIRACQYFYLSQFFGAAPLVKNTLTLSEANTVKKATKTEVQDFAEAEFKEVAPLLPRSGQLAGSERGRATNQASLAFLGRLYLAEEKWALAASTYKQIIDFNDNVIDPNFESLFNGTNETSKEIIFATQYQQDLAPNAMMQHNYPAKLGGFMLDCPLGSLVESYEFTDGAPFSFTDPRYNAGNPGENRDPRLKYTVLYNGQPFKNIIYNSNPDDASSPDQLTTSKQGTRTGFALKKFNSEAFSGGDLQNSGIDLPIIRYAEVLLGYLEAKLENGEGSDQALLDATINKVRGRSGVNMPRVTEMNTVALRTILRRERRNELALEGIRYWDLLRWKTIGQVLNGDFYGAAFPGAKNLRKKGTATDPYSRWYVTSKAFRVGIDELWPVPQSEVSINPNLK